LISEERNTAKFRQVSCSTCFESLKLAAHSYLSLGCLVVGESRVLVLDDCEWFGIAKEEAKIRFIKSLKLQKLQAR
jgi:hypothetical protein